MLLQGSNYNFLGASLPTVFVALENGAFSKATPGIYHLEFGYYVSQDSANDPARAPFDRYRVDYAYVPGEDPLQNIFTAALDDPRFAGYSRIA